MTSHRTILSALVLTVAMASGEPALAAANSLLSGYGGPGTGSQAIIGSALLNGSGGNGGGGSGGGSSSSSSGSFRYGEQPGASGSSSPAATGAGSRLGREGAAAAGAKAGRRGTRAAGATSGSRPAGAGGSSASAVRTYPTSSVADSGESEMLGLSGEDLLYILLVFAVLAFTGVLTGRLARTKGAGRHQPLKGRAAGPE